MVIVIAIIRRNSRCAGQLKCTYMVIVIAIIRRKSRCASQLILVDQLTCDHLTHPLSSLAPVIPVDLFVLK